MTSSYASKGRYVNDKARIDGKIVIVTGANTGLGKATALELAKRGGKIYLACRSEERGMVALKEITEASGSSDVHFAKLDLASLESIREFSKKFHELEPRIDILINNAGLLSPLERTKEQFELNMGVNHLGHFLLTHLLLDLLKTAAPSRIIVVSSDLHSYGSIDKENFNSEKSFAGTWKAYANSKLANVLFTRELSKILEGTGVTVNALCPGVVATEATRYMNLFMRMLMAPFVALFYKKPEAGAQTTIMLSVEPEVAKITGKYFVSSLEKEPSDKAKDDEMAKWLWKRSQDLTGLEEAENK